MFLPINLISGALIVVMGVVLPQHLVVILFDYRRGTGFCHWQLGHYQWQSYHPSYLLANT